MKKSILKAALLCGTVLALLTGCSGEESVYNDPPGAETISAGMDETEQKAFDTALAEAIHLINSGENTRSSRKLPERNRLRCQPLRARHATRSDGSHPQGDIYAVNFGDNEGFSIISTIPGRPRVYAFSATGEFTFDRTKNNDGINSYIDWLEYESQEESRLPHDSLWVPGITNPPTPPEPWPGQPNLPSINVIASPILPDAVALWNQNHPFNQYTPIFGSSRAFTGCVAVACAQIMAAFKWPESYEGYHYDWDAMRSGQNNDMVASLMIHLGYGRNLDMKYRDPNGNNPGSSADPANIPRTFENFGYKKPSLTDKYNSYEIIASLKESRPVMVGGKNEIGATVGKGHRWVIDGVMQSSKQDLEDNSDPEFPGIVSTYYHCVWGWGSDGPIGWYLFTTHSDKDQSYNFDHDSSESFYRYKELTWITDIYKKP